MPPDERTALLRARKQMVISLAIVLVIAFAVVVVMAAVLAVQRSTAQHVLGMSEKHRGVVTEIDEVGLCSRRHTDTYTVEWIEGGEARTGTFGLCGDPYDVGEELTVWVTDGDLQTDPPWMVRLGVGAPVLLLLVALLLVLRHGSRRRRSLAAALDGSWQPESLHTLGLPGSAAFRVVDVDTGAAESVGGWRIRFVHSTAGEASLPAATVDDMPGVVHCDRIRRGRPKGLCLHTGADGSRSWFTR